MVTVRGCGLGDVSGIVESDKCWDVVICAGTDGRRGLDEVGAT